MKVRDRTGLFMIAALKGVSNLRSTREREREREKKKNKKKKRRKKEKKKKKKEKKGVKN